MTSRSHALLAAAAAVLLAVALPAAAHAKKLPKVQFKDFVLQSAVVTRQLDWHYQSTERTIECSSWVVGSGDRLISYRLDKPTKYKLIKVGRQVTLSPEEAVHFSGDVSRRFDWRPHDNPCGRCGGELGACDDDRTEGPRLPTNRDFDCRPRRLVAPQLHFVMHAKGTDPHDELFGVRGEDWISVEPNTAAFYDNCPPTQAGGPGIPRHLAPWLVLTGDEFAAMMRAKPGAPVTLAGKRTEGNVQEVGSHDREGRYLSAGSCPQLSGPGRQMCERLTVRAVFKRVR